MPPTLCHKRPGKAIGFKRQKSNLNLTFCFDFVINCFQLNRRDDVRVRSKFGSHDDDKSNDESKIALRFQRLQSAKKPGGGFTRRFHEEDSVSGSL